MGLLAAGIALVLALGACGSDGDEASPVDSDAGNQTSADAAAPASGTDAVSLQPGPLPERLEQLSASFTQHAEVFGVDIVGTAATPAESITHAASVMAQYLDNDGDGMPDDQAVLTAMVENNALLFMGAAPDELGEDLFGSAALDGFGAQDLYASETNQPGRFDIALEEVHHLIATQGWANVYADQLSQERGSVLAQAMDEARGGQFDDVPTSYPEGAWYHYDDRTCDYSCMATEYLYWAHTSLLGAQADPERCDEISVEWEPCTADALRSTDTAITELLEDPDLGLPTRLPDGDYEG